MKDDFVFEVHWYDSNSEQTRKFLLTFYPGDNSVEMFDPKIRKIFLKRIHCSGVDAKDFYIGNSVVIFSRRLQIVDYGSEATRIRLNSHSETTIAVIRPGGISSLGDILKDIDTCGYTLGKARMVQLDSQCAREFIFSKREDEDFEEIIEELTSGPIIALEIMGEKVVCGWRSHIESDSKHKLNFVQFDSTQNVSKDLEFFFSNPYRAKSSANCRNSTCCIIKPHAIKEGQLSSIIQDIQSHEHFKITALESFHLRYANAEEFFEIYKGIVEDYSGMVKELSSGRCIALEISDTRSNLNENNTEVVSRFREIVGPSDPTLCKTLRPHSLRAKYGRSKDHNAVHCTDLPEDGVLELEYFFQILQH
ncbi:nucleoside diphosphate kinase homolog 7 [Lepeophtheirus salmonis]|uniref:nucleoside diphosphate kinase homolog 7 n=1 Tax=Lepeophtheirus salmonis TaxID=72036 RepID=UPI001AE11A57|nr:nucleoside diphosphate kinase 7-like [Lepeophtheirus salmonis]